MPTLDWLNRAHAFTIAAQVPYRLLHTVSSHGDAQAAADNLLIQGDNLEALKALLPFYRGRVKCIFIDPPYNTQSAFEHYDDKLEHSQWLSMMLPRLQLLRELLCDDGSIWVTIDDNEGHYLKVLMDEVLGRGNFVADVAWHKRVSPANDARYFSGDHDHVLVYAKSKPLWQPKRLPRSKEQTKYYTNPDNDPRGDWNSAAYTCAKTADERPNLYYPLIHPRTGKEVWPKRTRVWAYSQEANAQHIQNNMLYWGVDGNANAPRIKKFLTDSGDVVPRSIWAHSESGHNQEAMLEGLALFADGRFGTPKPERLLQRILHIATNPGDLVLDSFLGSGTTAAVAHKMGRRWIGIEMGEHAATHCLPRLEKVIAGEPGGISAAVGWQGGGGFRYCTLGAPIFDAHGGIHPEVRFATLAAFIWQQETGRVWDAAQGQPGTPWLGTYSVFESCSRLTDGHEGAISLEGGDGAGPHPSPPPEGEGERQGGAARELLLPPLGEGGDGGQPVLQSRTAYYLLFNGILGDKRPASGNVLTRAVLEALLQLHASTPYPDAPLVVYGEANRLGPETLARARVTFKHIPYDVKAR
ncbi:MAG: DNA methylase [Comamonas sp. SCN 65-56]|uniref:site-specific DNA-methyltransferase n=1 Tax=Comamonas sp. SCN 65-56 TaxID=1660095 RepID=UPI00086CD283|nr:site-specific DNA-methyltransferase [Comamonas sp. SCN 65-56]ODS91704.1 MAG: DNA methylase [Comamonas sp. SCN 65-56]